MFTFVILTICFPRKNTKKTKVVVFKKGGRLSKSEKWSIGSEKLESVPYYKYLGLVFSCRNVFSRACQILCEQAEKALYPIKKFIRKFKSLPCETSLKIFDGKIQPILLYGSEIWGTVYRHNIEKVHSKFCKFVLGVGYRSPSKAVLAECGRYPLHVNYKTRVISYWLRLLSQPDTRYPKRCYNMLKNLDDTGDSNWTSSVRMLLFHYGFAFAWIHQTVGDPNMFMKTFKQRCRDIYFQEWSSEITQSKYLYNYSLFKTDIVHESYLKVLPSMQLRRALTKFRCGISKLNVQAYRRSKSDDKSTAMCSRCTNIIDDEYHVLLQCPWYHDLRSTYIPQYYYVNPNMQKFIQLINNQNTKIILRLAIFVNKL